MIESGVIVCGVRLFCPRHSQDHSRFGEQFYSSVVWMKRVAGEGSGVMQQNGGSTSPTTPNWCAARPATAQPVEHLHGMQRVRFEPSIALLQVEFFGAASLA